MIKNIVFDFGGVIVDIDRDKAVQAFIKLGLTGAVGWINIIKPEYFRNWRKVNLALMNLENNWEIYADESLLWKKPNRHGWASSTK